jgi:hypothetical protein
MNLEHRIDLLVQLGEYLLSEDEGWQQAKQRASAVNGWFIPEFVDLAVRQIAGSYLQKDHLEKWTQHYPVPAENAHPHTAGLIMAGNIPLVGFHDFLCLFITGHRQIIKPSSRDESLIRRVVEQLIRLDPETGGLVSFADRLKGCDIFIGTGSNNSARYFDYYFGKYPHIIRRNRTSVAILSGGEGKEELEGLADDTHQYFGLGCRNVTKLYVPENYDFIPLLQAFRKYGYLAEHNKYRNNYDYHLALLLLNKKYYMTNGSILLAEDPSPFSPISVLHYEYYKPGGALPGNPEFLSSDHDIQCIVGQGYIPFGMAQHPVLDDYADGVDTLQFILSLPAILS